jgi:hypothetical protein
VKGRGRSLEIDESLDFQRREWQLQRIGWWGLAAFVVAAGLGAFGNGPLSHAAAADPGGALRVEYERFLRMGAVHRIQIRARATGASGPLHLHIAREYYDAIEIERVQPEPEAVEIGPREVTLGFRPITAGELAIVIDSKPRRAGPRRLEIRSSTGGTVAIRQFVYF